MRSTPGSRSARDGVVTVAVPQLEMGQGITTLLPQIVAVELGADWRQVAVEPAPVSGAYANLPLAARWAPLWMPVVPGAGGRCRRPADAPLGRRQAASTPPPTAPRSPPTNCRAARPPRRARAMLAMAAADRWDVGWEECEARRRLHLHGEQAAEFRANWPRRRPVTIRPIRRRCCPTPAAEDADARTGRRAHRLSRGSTCRPRSMAAICSPATCACPTWSMPRSGTGRVDQAELSGSTASAAAGTRGLVDVVRGQALAGRGRRDNWWAAEQALSADAPALRRRTSAVDSATIEAALDEGGAARRGDADCASAARRDSLMDKPDLALRYDFAPALHATLETASATARLRRRQAGAVDGQPGARSRAGRRRQGAGHFRQRRGALSDAGGRQFRPAAGTRPRDRGGADRARSRRCARCS